jgi:DNA repair exonuclease SbcCD ATPase subunit
MSELLPDPGKRETLGRDSRKDLIEEVKRLRATLEGHAVIWPDLRGELRHSHDEIERLRAERDAAERQSKAFQEMNRKNGETIFEYDADVKRLKAKVERLRAELEDWKAAARAEAQAGDEARGEAKRLRSLDRFGAYDLLQRAERVEAEVKRLRAERDDLYAAIQYHTGMGGCDDDADLRRALEGGE